MGNYEKNNPLVDKEEKQKRSPGLKTKQSNEETRKRLKSFLNTDTNHDSEKHYAKEERKNTLTWIEDEKGKLIQIDVKKRKKNKIKK
jgi:hypothetical protein